MKIRIKDDRKIDDIQEKFNEHFPYLKLEFFSKPHKNGSPSPKSLMKRGDSTIGECRTVKKTGDMIILPQMTVTQLEQNFKDIYGLNVQVFRRSGNVWLETSVTDSWTLEEQNSQGQTLSEVIMYNSTPQQNKRLGS
jgi:hypothetical protein